MRALSTFVLVIFVSAIAVNPIVFARGKTIHETFSQALLETKMNLALAEEEGKDNEGKIPEDLKWKIAGAKKVRVLMRTGNILEGRTLPDVDFNQIAKIDVSAGTVAGTGAEIGAGCGSILTLLAVLGAEDAGYSSSAMLVAGLLVYVGGGAALGALIGLAFPKWETIYVK